MFLRSIIIQTQKKSIRNHWKSSWRFWWERFPHFFKLGKNIILWRKFDSIKIANRLLMVFKWRKP